MRGAIKGTLKIDIDGGGKDDGSLTSGTSALDLTKTMGNLKERLLVFEDLERCRMEIDTYRNGRKHPWALPEPTASNVPRPVHRSTPHHGERRADFTKPFSAIDRALVCVAANHLGPRYRERKPFTAAPIV